MFKFVISKVTIGYFTYTTGLYWCLYLHIAEFFIKDYMNLEYLLDSKIKYGYVREDICSGCGGGDDDVSSAWIQSTGR